MEWLRVWEDPEPRGAAESMAVDHALLLGAESAVLRIYRWAQPCVSCGYFAAHAEVARVAGGLPWVRRWTGGGVVWHGGDWAYTLVVPRSEALAALPAGESYRWIHGALLGVLGSEEAAGGEGGITLAAPAVPLRAGAASACFENPVSHDLLCGGRKVGGAGQRRTRDGLLHQGSVQLPREQHPQTARVAAALARGSAEFVPGETERRKAEELYRERYSTDAWRLLR